MHILLLRGGFPALNTKMQSWGQQRQNEVGRTVHGEKPLLESKMVQFGLDAT